MELASLHSIIIELFLTQTTQIFAFVLGNRSGPQEGKMNFRAKFANLSKEFGRQIELGVRPGDLERSALVVRYRELRCRSV